MKELLLWFLWEFLFQLVCGCIGHYFVKLVTFGKVDLGYGEGSDSIVAELIGFAVVIGLGVIVAAVFYR